MDEPAHVDVTRRAYDMVAGREAGRAGSIGVGGGAGLSVTLAVAPAG